SHGVLRHVGRHGLPVASAGGRSGAFFQFRHGHPDAAPGGGGYEVVLRAPANQGNHRTAAISCSACNRDPLAGWLSTYAALFFWGPKIISAAPIGAVGISVL